MHPWHPTGRVLLLHTPGFVETGMWENVQFVCVGAAAIIDTVLLAALFERRNWRFVPTPIPVLCAGAWLWHAGLLTDLLLANTTAARPYLIVIMAFGLLLMPCAMLHALWRVRRSGLQVGMPVHWRYVLLYLPLFALVPLSLRLRQVDGNENLLTLFGDAIVPYMIWLTAVNVLAALGFSRVRHRHAGTSERWFLAALAIGLLSLTALQVLIFLVIVPLMPAWADAALVLAVLSPLLPALLFGYFLLRFNFLHLVLARSLLYGGAVVAAVLLHEVVMDRWPSPYRLPLGVLELVTVSGLVLVWAPIRQRVAEALRYLLGSRIAVLRRQTRAIAVAIGRGAGQEPAVLLHWFSDAMRKTLAVDFVAAWSFDAAGGVRGRWCAGTRLGDESAQRLFDRMRSNGISLCDRRHAPDDILTIMHEADAALVALPAASLMHVLFVFGRRTRNRDFSEEERTTVAFLVEQLGISLHIGVVQRERLAAERRAAHSEKLSALGLLASAVAHEVKNPLSSIKTIAGVLAEDLGPDSPHREDLRLIGSEVERLSATVTRLLDDAKPERRSTAATGSVTDVVAATMRLLRHLAKQRGVVMDARLEHDLLRVCVTDEVLHEVFINLLANSIEAAGSGGSVTIAAWTDQGQVVITFQDSGPGLAAEIAERLFEPFTTTKEHGNGLGLYVVSQRIRAAGGTITWDHTPEQGTTFRMTLPSIPLENSLEAGSKNLEESCIF